MRTLHQSSILRCGAALFVMAACAFATNAAPPPPAERTLERLSAPVQQTIREQMGNGRLRAIDPDNENGRVSYDVEIVRQGRVRGFTVGEDGGLIDTEVFLDELPVPVRRTIRKKVAGGTLGEIDRSIESDGASYEVEVIDGTTTRNFTVDAKGKLTDEQVFLPELPADFQAGIKKVAGAGTVDEITRSFEEGDTFYDVDVVENGRTQTLTFDAKGSLVSKQEDVALPAVPQAAQKQIQTLAAGGKLVTVSKVTENGAVSFDVDVREAGTVKSFTVAEDGSVVASEGR